MVTKKPTSDGILKTEPEVQGHSMAGGSLADDELQGLLAKATDEQLDRLAQSLVDLYREQTGRGSGVLATRKGLPTYEEIMDDLRL